MAKNPTGLCLETTFEAVNGPSLEILEARLDWGLNSLAGVGLDDL